MVKITVEDLTEAVRMAIALTASMGQPTVIAGALAMAAHGYRRETHDVDIVLPVVIGAVSGDRLEEEARAMGLEVRAKHGFGGLDLRSNLIRIDVLTLDRDMPELIPDAVAEALASDRRMDLFGSVVHVVSLGHLVAMKLMAERKKDIADIVELIKERMELGQWDRDQPVVIDVVKRFLGWSAGRDVTKYATTARYELGG